MARIAMMKAAALCCLLLAASAPAGESASAGLSGAEWPQFKGGPGFTGVSPDEVKPPLKLVWAVCVGVDGSGDAGGGCTVAGGKVFVTIAETRTLVALDAASGEYLWGFRRQDVSMMVPAYHDGRVYLWTRRSTTHYAIALDAANGKELWRTPLESKGIYTEEQRCSLPVHDGKVFCVTGGAKPAVVALDEKTGKDVWRSPLAGTLGPWIGPPCVAGGRVYVGTSSGNRKDSRGTIAAFDEATGKELWKREDLGTMLAPSSDGKVLALAASDSSPHLLDAETGKTLWDGPAGASFYSNLTLTGEMLMGKAYGSYFNAYDRKTGKVLWTFRETAASGCCTPSVSGRYAYFGTGAPGVGGNGFAVHFEKPVAEGRGTNIHAVDLTTGKSVWSFMTGFNVCGEPAIAYGRVYAVSRDGRVYCFGPAKEGEPTTPEAKDKSPNAPADEVKKLLAPELADKPRPGKDWPMEGGTPERAGIEVTGFKPPLELAWKIDAGGPVHSSAAIRDGRIFVGSDAGKLLAIDAAGRIAWEGKTGGAVRCSPAAAGGLVYCGSDDGGFYAWDAAGGQQKWKFEAGGPVRASPAVVGGIVVFGADDHNVYALDRNTGKKLWSFRGSGYQVAAPPVVHGDTVYFIEGINWVHALDLATGQERWKRFFPKRLDGIALYRDRLWVNGSHMAALDPQTGKMVVAAYGAASGRPGFSKSSMLLVPAVYNLDAEDRKPGYELGLPRQQGRGALKDALRWTPMAMPLMLEDAFAFTNCGNPLLGTRGDLAVTKPDGTVLWSFEFGAACTVPPVAADGLMVVGAGDGRVCAFREKAR